MGGAPKKATQVELVVDDFSRRLSASVLEASQWRARAISAEVTLQEIQDAEEAEAEEEEEKPKPKAKAKR